MNIEKDRNLWNKFQMSGLVSDYLNYKMVEAVRDNKEETIDDNTTDSSFVLNKEAYSCSTVN